MIYSLLLLCSALLCSRKKERKIKTRLHSFFILIHSFHSITSLTNPTQPNPTHQPTNTTTTNTTNTPTSPQHAHPTNPPPPPPPAPPPLHNPQPRHPRHLQPDLTHLSNFTNVQRIFPPDLEFSFRYARFANFGGDFSGDCGVEWDFCGGGRGLWEWGWEWGRRKGDGMFFLFFILKVRGTNHIHPQLQLPTNAILLASSLSSTLLSIIALALQATLNHQSPQRDTLQTWTCMWKNVQGEGVPQSFDTLCHETVSSTLPYVSKPKKKKEISR